MSRFLLTLLTAALSLAVFGLAGCADDDSGLHAQCTYDSDCSGDDSYCLAQSCAPACSSDDECPSNTFCEAYQRVDDGSPVQACLDANTASNGGVDCSSNQECRDALDDPSARCGIHNRCVLTSDDNGANGEPGNSTPGNNDADPNNAVNQQNPPPELTFLHLQRLDDDNDDDDNDDDDADDLGDPLTPLLLSAVLVRDADERAIGIGELVSITPTSDSAYADLVGAPIPVDDSGQCLDEPHTQPFSKLQEPQSVAVIALVNPDGEPLLVDAGYSIDLFVAHDQCPLGADANTLDDTDQPPSFSLSLCDDDQPLVDEVGCLQHWDGPYSGFTRIEVANPSDSG